MDSSIAYNNHLKANAGGICYFGWQFKDGRVETRHGPCHAGMHPYAGHKDEKLSFKDTVAVTSSLWRYKFKNEWDDANDMDQKIAENFWTWLIKGEDSPYSKVTKNAEIWTDKEQGMFAVQITDGIHRSAAELVNFLIATRMPREHKSSVEMWQELVDDGFTGLEALYLQHFFYRSMGKIQPQVMGRGHYPYNPRVSFDKLKKGMSAKVDKSYVQDTNYHPCNSIWGGAGNEYYIEHPFFKIIAGDKPEEKYKYTGSFIKMYEAVANDNIPGLSKATNKIDPNYKNVVAAIIDKRELVFK